MKVLLAAVLIVLLAAIAFGLVTLLWWWLIPLAFPALAGWGFWNAAAFSAIVLLIWAPAVVN